MCGVLAYPALAAIDRKLAHRREATAAGPAADPFLEPASESAAESVPESAERAIAA